MAADEPLDPATAAEAGVNLLMHLADGRNHAHTSRYDCFPSCPAYNDVLLGAPFGWAASYKEGDNVPVSVYLPPERSTREKIMSEHIVARALRARADALRKKAAADVRMEGLDALVIATQFELLADELAGIESQPVASRVTEHHPQFRVRVGPEMSTRVDVSVSGGKTITIGRDRLNRASIRMCDAYLGDGTWMKITEGQRMQWVQLAEIAIQEALGPDHD